MNDQLIHEAFEEIAGEARPSAGDWPALERNLRRQGRIRYTMVAAVSVAVLVAAVVFVPRLQHASSGHTLGGTPNAGLTPGSPTYTDAQGGFQVSYPSGWALSYPKGPQYPLLTSPGGNGVSVAMSSHASRLDLGCSVPTSDATAQVSYEIIAGVRAMRCEQDGVPLASARVVTYTIARATDQQRWVYFTISSFTTTAWDQYGAEAEGIVRTLTWTK